MKPYNYFNNPCPKCGNGDKPALVEYKVGCFDEMMQQAYDLTEQGVMPSQYLLRTCRCCGYKWAELSLTEEPEVRESFFDLRESIPQPPRHTIVGLMELTMKITHPLYVAMKEAFYEGTFFNIRFSHGKIAPVHFLSMELQFTDGGKDMLVNFTFTTVKKFYT